MVIDDINTIRDANASTFSKTLAANFIPISKFVKSGKLFYKLVSSSGREIEREQLLNFPRYFPVKKRVILENF